VLTLLVPASFAWAVVVHRIFDFRVALRATAVAVSLAVAAAAAFVAGEWLGDLWLPAHSVQWGGTTLATLVLMVTLAGPIRPWGRSLAERTSRASSLQTLGGATRDAPAPRDDELLEGAARALTDTLRLDACAVAWLDAPRPRSGVLGEIERSPTLVAALTGRRGVMLADDSTLHPDDRAALESLGVHWMLPVGGERPRAALLLGRRLAGPWLDRAETVELERLADRLTITLENAVLRRAAESHGAIDRELAEAGQIQAHLLPRRAPVYPSLDCAAAALSCEPVGGDYFDFVEHTDREFTLVVGDAAGKGVPAALLLAGVRARIRGEELRERGPGQLLHALNRELVHLEQPEKFVGLLCAHVDARRGRVCLANAGITPPLVRRRGGGFEELTAGGVLLGVSAEAVYPDTSVELRAGDVAVIYTDGLSEARRGEELFGVDRVRAVLDRHAHRRASQILEALLDGVRAFADRPLDDLTVLVLKQLADPPTAVALAASELKLRLASADTSG
jgi:serine phosphatase RsbU (regulator of sigma subunit)